MSEGHTSAGYDAELGAVSRRVHEMGALAEAQATKAVHALVRFSVEEAADVLQAEDRLNKMEVEIDREMQRIIARRQPTSVDLRLLIAISKAATNLERIGDEAKRVARTVQRLVNVGVSTRMRMPVADLQYEGELACNQLRKALNAFVRLDVGGALEVMKLDRQIDQEFEGLLRTLITYTMEDPRTILILPRSRVRRQGDRAYRRSRKEPGRDGDLCGEGYGRPPRHPG